MCDWACDHMQWTSGVGRTVTAAAAAAAAATAAVTIVVVVVLELLVTRRKAVRLGGHKQ